MDKLNENVKFDEGRIFIDITYKGCGSGCSYCYVNTKSENQLLISSLELKQVIDYIIESDKYIKGKEGSIISLCPNTEPLKSKESIRLVEMILKKFLPEGNPIQISTKEKIDEEIFKNIQNYIKYKSQLYVNISLPTISKSEIIEPGAANIRDRIENFNLIKKYDMIHSILYIKPFMTITLEDRENYLEIIEKYKPDSICIGIDFLKYNLDKEICPCDLLYKDIESSKKAIKIAINKGFNEFSKQIQIASSKIVFHSSICIIAYVLGVKPKLNINNKYKILCSNCGICIN